MKGNKMNVKMKDQRHNQNTHAQTWISDQMKHLNPKATSVKCEIYSKKMQSSLKFKVNDINNK